MTESSPLLWVSVGSERNNPCVYGCLGLLKSASTAAVSTILPAYITATRSQVSATTPWSARRLSTTVGCKPGPSRSSPAASYRPTVDADIRQSGFQERRFQLAAASRWPASAHPVLRPSDAPELLPLPAPQST